MTSNQLFISIIFLNFQFFTRLQKTSDNNRLKFVFVFISGFLVSLFFRIYRQLQTDIPKLSYK